MTTAAHHDICRSATVLRPSEAEIKSPSTAKERGGKNIITHLYHNHNHDRHQRCYLHHDDDHHHYRRSRHHHHNHRHSHHHHHHHHQRHHHHHRRRHRH